MTSKNRQRRNTEILAFDFAQARMTTPGDYARMTARTDNDEIQGSFPIGYAQGQDDGIGEVWLAGALVLGARVGENDSGPSWSNRDSEVMD